MPTPRPDGPLTAPLLFVGEAPGPQEMRQGIPFCGATGEIVRGILRRAGLSCNVGSSNQVRFNNIVPDNPGTITGNQRDSLVARWWDNITDDLARTEARVILACGGVALRRLTGLTSISDEHGSVIPADALPATLTIAGQTRSLGLPPNALILPCLHPAGIMRSALRAGLVTVKRVLERAAEYARGKVFTPEVPGIEGLEMVPIFWASPRKEEAWAVLENSSVIVLDTEFPKETHVPISVQFLGDTRPQVVYWFKPEPRMTEAFGARIRGKQLVAHYHPAELYSLAKVGLDLSQEGWFDTLLAWATLYPDEEVALPNPVLYYCDNERYWKGLSTEDPLYMFKDVRNCYRIFVEMRRELAEYNMLGLFYDEVMPSMELTERLEHEGLQVDATMQATMLKANEEQRTRLLAKIHERVPASDKLVKLKEAEIKRLLADNPSVAALQPYCELHPYDGVRGKKFADDPACRCKQVYDWVTERVGRESYRPFQPSNPHDLRWLLYEHWKLPKQPPAKGSKAPSTGADAIQRLTVRMQEAFNEGKKKSKYYREDAPTLIAFILDCKELQHLEKMASTFLRPPVDEHGVAHPPYRLWGTGTGRLAGGFDEAISADGGGSEYSFNPLNIPKETRCLFKADDVLLGDWRGRRKLCP